MILEIDKRAVCITHDYKMAAIISTYFNHENRYFSVFYLPNVKKDGDIVNKISGEINSIFISNRIIKLKPEFIILAGLSNFQKSLFKKFKNILSIDNLEEIHDKLKIFNSFDGDLLCSEKDLIKGLFVAKQENKRIIIDKSAPPINIVNKKKGIISVIEDHLDVFSLTSINYISTIKSDLVIIPSVSEKQLSQLKKYLFRHKSEPENIEIDCHVKVLTKNISGIKFNIYTRAIFFTIGVPYGYLINNSIPNSHVFSRLVGYFIFDNIFISEFHDTFFSFLNFSIFKNDESSKIIKIFKKCGFYTKNLSEEDGTSTRYNFKNYVEHFPYDILHICSHGGMLSGNFIKKDFLDDNGNMHSLEYYEVVDFEKIDRIDSRGEPLIGVTRKLVYIKLDGYPWASDELHNANIPESVIKKIRDVSSIDGLNGEDVVIVPFKGYIPSSCYVKCLDNIHQGNFHYLAGQTSPIIFNNSCHSWDSLAYQWIGRGARGYVGTLWEVGDDVAKYSAENFYRFALNNNAEIVSCVFNLNKRIKKEKYKNIYIYWGLPLVKIEKPAKPIMLKSIISGVSRALMEHLRGLESIYKDKSTEEEVRENSFDVLKFIFNVLAFDLKVLNLNKLRQIINKK